MKTGDLLWDYQRLCLARPPASYSPNSIVCCTAISLWGYALTCKMRLPAVADTVEEARYQARKNGRSHIVATDIRNALLDTKFLQVKRCNRCSKLPRGDYRAKPVSARVRGSLQICNAAAMALYHRCRRALRLPSYRRENKVPVAAETVPSRPKFARDTTTTTDGYMPEMIKQCGLRDDGSVLTDFDVIGMDEGRWYPRHVERCLEVIRRVALRLLRRELLATANPG